MTPFFQESLRFRPSTLYPSALGVQIMSLYFIEEYAKKTKYPAFQQSIISNKVFP